MDPRYLNVYSHSDCSGGLVHVRWGPSVNHEPLRSCRLGVETATHTSQYLPNRQYMQIKREYATDMVLDATCVPTGLAPSLFSFAECATMTHAVYTDVNCSERVPVVEIARPVLECFTPNDGAVPPMPHPPPMPKYLKKYANMDCSGPLTYVATLQGVVAIAHDTQSCVDGFELTLVPPRSEDYEPGAAYMHMENCVDCDAYSLVLDRACVEFAPRKFIAVDCNTQRVTYHNDSLCRAEDAGGASGSLAPRRSKLPLNCSIPSVGGEMLSIQGDPWTCGAVALSVAVAAVAGMWRAVQLFRRRRGHMRLLK